MSPPLKATFHSMIFGLPVCAMREDQIMSAEKCGMSCHSALIFTDVGIPRIDECPRMERYSMFHVTLTTFKFNRNQLGTVSAFVMISVPWSNQRAHEVFGEKLFSKEFHCRTTDHK